MLKFLRTIFGKPDQTKPMVRTQGNGSVGGYGYNKAKASPKIFFNKIEEKLNAFESEFSYRTTVNLVERNKYLALKTESEIISRLGSPIQRLEVKESEDVYTSLKYNYNISDYSVRLLFFLINGKSIGFLYEFKEVFTNQNNKLKLIFESVYTNYNLAPSGTLEEFILRSERNPVHICDPDDNRMIILNNVLLNVFYIREARKLTAFFNAIMSRKEESEQEIKRRRMHNLNENL